VNQQRPPGLVREVCAAAVVFFAVCCVSFYFVLSGPRWAGHAILLMGFLPFIGLTRRWQRKWAEHRRNAPD
jgi:hypothetical protein